MSVLPDARFYWYPSPNGTLRTIDLDGLTAAYPADRQEYTSTRLSQSTRADSRVFTAFHGSSTLVSVRCEAIESQTTVDKLRSMIHFMKLGRPIGFALDYAHAWGSYTRTPVTQDIPNIGVAGHVWYEAAPTIAAGGRLVLESAAPECFMDTIVEDTGLTAATTVLTCPTQGPEFTYSGIAHVRHPDFWPVLVLPKSEANRNHLRSNADQTWTLDITFIYDIGAALAVAQGRNARQTTDSAYTGVALQDAVFDADSLSPQTAFNRGF